MIAFSICPPISQFIGLISPLGITFGAATPPPGGNSELTDEAGNLLTDEAGNTLTGE